MYLICIQSIFFWLLPLTVIIFTDVYENKSIVQQQSDRSKSSLPASRNSFILDMDDDNHIHHVRHQQHHHKSANIDHGDYGFPTLDSIHSTIEKNHGGHSPNSAAAAASVNRKSITRKSSSIMLITLFDTLILMMMLALAIILRFTDEIKPIETWFSKRLVCMFPELYSWPFKVVSNTEGVLLFDKLSSTEFLFFLFVFIIPIAAVSLIIQSYLSTDDYLDYNFCFFTLTDYLFGTKSSSYSSNSSWRS